MTVSVAVLSVACATKPENRSSADGHDAAVRAHMEFARDFKEAGNEPMSRYHLQKAAIEQEKKDAKECGLLCTIIEELLDTKPDTVSPSSCRDPVTNPPFGSPPPC
jgi:hypothetical protein